MRRVKFGRKKVNERSKFRNDSPLDRSHTARFLSCDASDRIQYKRRVLE